MLLITVAADNDNYSVRSAIYCKGGQKLIGIDWHVQCPVLMPVHCLKPIDTN